MSSVFKVQEIVALGHICFIKVKASKQKGKKGESSDFEYLMVFCRETLILWLHKNLLA